MSVSFMPNVEGDLESKAVAKLAPLGLTLESPGFRLMSMEETEQQLGQKFLACRALEIQYYKIPLPREKPVLLEVNFRRYRLFKNVDDITGQRYTQKAGTGNHAYIPPAIDVGDWWDLKVPLVITEGELKAVCAVHYGYLAMAVPGISAIRESATGALLEALTMIPAGKTVWIVYDTEPRKYLSDGVLDPGSAWVAVQRDRARLAAMLSVRGVNVYYLDLPSTGKLQLDDFLLQGGDLHQLTPARAQWTQHPSSALGWLQSRFVIFGGAMMDISLGPSRALENTMRPASFKVQYGHLLDDDAKSIASAFPVSKYSTRIDGVCFSPEKPYRITENHEWNLWAGWKTVPKEGDPGPWLDCLDLMFDEQPALKHEYLKTISWCLKHPGAKQQRYMMAKGTAEGTGKSWLLELPVKLMNGIDPFGGPAVHGHGLQDNAGKCLDSKHNALLLDKLYVVSNELSSENKKELSHYVKSIVTDSTLRIERKYVDAIMVPSLFLFAFTTNEIRVLDLNADTRRCLALPGWSRRTPKALQMCDFWEAQRKNRYFKWEAQNLPAIMWYLLNYDTGDYDGSQPPLKSIYLDEAASDNLADTEVFAMDYLDYHNAPVICMDFEYQSFLALNPVSRIGVGYFRNALQSNCGYVKPNCERTKGQINGNKRPPIRGKSRITIRVHPQAVDWSIDQLWDELLKRYEKKV